MHIYTKANVHHSAYRRDWRSPVAPISPKWASGLDGAHIFKHMCFCRFLKFSVFCRDWRSPGTLSSPKRASRLDGVHFFKRREFDDLCENSAFRRDWRSSAHLLEGLGPHASNPGWPKWLPQAPLRPRRTNQRTVVIGARPVPLLPPNWLFQAATSTTLVVVAALQTKIESKRPQTL